MQRSACPLAEKDDACTPTAGGHSGVLAEERNCWHQDEAVVHVMAAGVKVL